jgi:hypothetical protein
MSDRTVVREVGLRDGLQNLAQFVPTEVKKAWIDAEHSAGFLGNLPKAGLPKTFEPVSLRTREDRRW